MTITSTIVVSSVLSMLSFIDQSMSDPTERTGNAQLQPCGQTGLFPGSP